MSFGWQDVAFAVVLVAGMIVGHYRRKRMPADELAQLDARSAHARTIGMEIGAGISGLMMIVAGAASGPWYLALLGIAVLGIPAGALVAHARRAHNEPTRITR